MKNSIAPLEIQKRKPSKSIKEFKELTLYRLFNLLDGRFTNRKVSTRSIDTDIQLNLMFGKFKTDQNMKDFGSNYLKRLEIKTRWKQVGKWSLKSKQSIILLVQRLSCKGKDIIKGRRGNV